MGESMGFGAHGLVQGTMIFGVLGLIGCVVALLIAKETANCTKGESRLLGLTVVSISTVCMWMLYAIIYFGVVIRSKS